ncbi:hypothetical protein [Promicromonospora sp. NPDC057488]|uniref:hypothetical protein n=1 Tax=Promicromonospora sp. NPDC057488 TaxID=3346147 RepID=UPI00366A9931
MGGIALNLVIFLQGNPSAYASAEFLPVVVALACTPVAVLLGLLPVRRPGHRAIATGGGVLLAAGASYLGATLYRLVVDLLILRANGSSDLASSIGRTLQSAGGTGQLAFAFAVIIPTIVVALTVARLAPPAPHEEGPLVEWASARSVATWATLPMIVLCFAGGFATRSRGLSRWETDWPTSGLATSLAEFFYEYRIGPLAGSTGIRNRNLGAELVYLLPALVTAAVFLLVVWLVVAWFVRALNVGSVLDAATSVIAVWGVVTLVSTVVAGTAAAIVEPPDLRFGLDLTIDGLRFGAVWGWLVGVAAVLALRAVGRSSAPNPPKDESEVAA